MIRVTLSYPNGFRFVEGNKEEECGLLSMADAFSVAQVVNDHPNWAPITAHACMALCAHTNQVWSERAFTSEYFGQVLTTREKRLEFCGINSVRREELSDIALDTLDAYLDVDSLYFDTLENRGWTTVPGMFGDTDYIFSMQALGLSGMSAEPMSLYRRHPRNK